MTWECGWMRCSKEIESRPAHYVQVRIHCVTEQFCIKLIAITSSVLDGFPNVFHRHTLRKKTAIKLLLQILIPTTPKTRRRTTLWNTNAVNKRALCALSHSLAEIFEANVVVYNTLHLGYSPRNATLSRNVLETESAFYWPIRYTQPSYTVSIKWVCSLRCT